MTNNLAPELQHGLYGKDKVEQGAKKQYEGKYGKLKKSPPLDPLNKGDKYLGKRKSKPTALAKASKEQQPKPKAVKKPPKRIRKPTEKAKALMDAQKKKGKK